jgi:hypothetical protein
MASFGVSTGLSDAFGFFVHCTKISLIAVHKVSISRLCCGAASQPPQSFGGVLVRFRRFRRCVTLVQSSREALIQPKAKKENADDNAEIEDR